MEARITRYDVVIRGRVLDISGGRQNIKIKTVGTTGQRLKVFLETQRKMLEVLEKIASRIA